MGSTIEMAFVLNGVSQRAGQYWLSMGRALVERGQAEGRPAETIESPWPWLPASLLVKLLNAVEHAKAVDEQNRILAITAAGDGGAVIFEKTVERVNNKTRIRTTETVRRFAPPDWKAHAFLLERRDPQRWGRKYDQENPAGAAVTKGAEGAVDLYEALKQVWALKSTDPRSLPPATTKAEVETTGGERQE
jgi:hypothetical protein